MININVNLATGTAALAQTTAIKAGGSVPVRITFSVPPGSNPLIELAISPQSSAPTVLAYLDEFSAQNSTVYTGTLDANDTRLIEHLQGKQQVTLNGELVVTVDGAPRRPFPNLPLTVQAPVITGPASSEGGPVYLTDAMLASKAEAESGTNNAKWMSPQRVAEAIAALGDLPPYLFRGGSFEAEAGKAYACDTSGTVEVPAVPPSFTAGGVIFTAKSFPGPDESITISAFNGGALVVGEFHVYTEPDATTCGQVVAAVNASLDAVFTASLAPGANAADTFPNLDDPFSFAGGSGPTEEFAPFEATLPELSVDGEERMVVAFCDALGTWGANAIKVLGNGAKIEGVEADFVNNAAGTFFAMVGIGGDVGWRVLASGTKPISLTPPTITGAYSFTGTAGTWTGNPTSYAYQWQISDDGLTGWADIEGATSPTYLATEPQEGKYVRLGVIATNANGPSVRVFSEPSVEIDIPPFPLAGLLAFWKLDDLTDSSGNGITLTNNNGMTFAPGLVGDAALLGGTGDGAYFSFDASLVNGLSTWTLSMWLKRDPATSNGNCAFSGDTYVCILLNATGEQVVGATGAGSVSAPYSHDNEWAHIVFQQDGASGKIYVNGVLEGTGTFSSGLGGAAYYHFPSQHSDQRLGGMMDAVGLWNRALSEPEISQLYNGGNGTEPA